MNVYDPTNEATALLKKHDPLVVVKGLLNQLKAARQTNYIMQFTDNTPATKEEMDFAIRIADSNFKFILEYLIKNPEEAKKLIKKLEDLKNGH